METLFCFLLTTLFYYLEFSIETKKRFEAENSEKFCLFRNIFSIDFN
jgi:hypothetical protein